MVASTLHPLPNARTLRYDLNHMLPDPYYRLPETAQHRVTVAARQMIFRRGQVANGLYVLLRGRVHLERVGPSGERFVIFRAASGRSFAEASVFSERYHCDAVCIENSDLVRIEKPAVLAAFSNSDFARAYGLQAARQVQEQRQLLEIIGIRNAKARVMAGLVAGLLESNIIDFAALLHLSHEATYRALRELTDEGQILNPKRGKYHIPDVS